MTHDNQHTEHESENARLRREHAAMKAFIQRIANRDKQDYMASPISMQILIDDARTLLAIYADTAIASSAPSPEGGNAGGTRLQNRNTEQFEDPTEYHNGVLYASPVTYHGKEILNWHIYDKSAKDKNDYCVERNIRTRAHAVAQVDMLAEMIAANAAHPASGSADTVAGSGNGGE